MRGSSPYIQVITEEGLEHITLVDEILMVRFYQLFITVTSKDGFMSTGIQNLSFDLWPGHASPCNST